MAVRPLTIVSVVGTARTGIPIEFAYLESKFGQYIQRESRTFAILRFPFAKGPVMVYKSGTLIFAGETSLEALDHVRRQVLSSLRDAGIPVALETPLAISNIVATGELRLTISFQLLVKKDPHAFEYEPEVFPGAIIRLGIGKALALLFSNGKYTITGVKSHAELEDARQKLESIVPHAPGHK